MDLKVSKTRHSIGPSLTQWGVVTLKATSPTRRRPPAPLADLEAEFNLLLAALRRLETEP